MELTNEDVKVMVEGHFGNVMEGITAVKIGFGGDIR